MVAIADDCHAAPHRGTDLLQRLGRGALHLHPILTMDKLETSKTITVLTLAFLIAYLIFDMKWLLWIAILLSLGNAFESRITTALAKYWMQFAAFLGKINSRIILTLMFFFLLTPIAFLYRLFNRDKVDHFLANKRSSYFDDTGKSYRREDFEKTW